MSAQRLALSSLLRNGQRFVSFPHPIQVQNDPHSDEDPVSNTSRLTDAVIPLAKILNVTPLGLQFSHNLSSCSSSVPPGLSNVDSILLLKSVKREGNCVSLYTPTKTKTCEVSVQTEDIQLSPESASSVLIEKLKGEMENQIGEELMSEGSRSEAIRRFQRAAAYGNVDAMYNLGDCLYNGIGVHLNKKEAFYLWTQAATLGHSASMYSIAVCYLSNIGDKSDFAMADKWMNLAAEAGDVDAAFYVIVSSMRKGHPECARRLIRTAARNGDYHREMRSWLEDECLNKQCLDVVREELDTYR